MSDDNAYAEALFRTLKYRPGYPRKPFESIEAARTWVANFVRWYNEEHRHSAIRYVTPCERHEGRDASILMARDSLYKTNRELNPGRWSGHTRDWAPVGDVVLNRIHPDQRQESSNQ